MRLLPNIRFGTERYPEEVARRLRALNIAIWMASATHAGYALVLFIDFTLWRLGVVNVVSALLYASVPLLHRFGRLVGPLAATLLLDADLAIYIWLLGTGVGIQFFYFPGVALAALFFGAEYIALTAVVGAVAAALIIGLQLTVPYDTGLIPPTLVVVSIITNAVVSCGIVLLVVSYALREAARAEAASERLLVNILPAKVADRLKRRDEAVIADKYDEASVLFADMAGYTASASDTDPDDLVKFLNRVFSDFDRLVERHALEKIKTTGDSYMVVSGVPTVRPDHAQALAALALDMREAASAWRDSHGRIVPIRMGMSSGPVVAGVVGTRKFFYDVWGDAVNVAARMETTGVAGKIQVSETTYLRLKDAFALEARGAIDIKGKGSMPTWFLLARKPLAAVQPKAPEAPEAGELKLPGGLTRKAV
jgi:adenylate cyclase